MAENVYLGMGSNIPPQSEYISGGLERLKDFFPALTSSKIHRSKPYRIETEFSFLNACVEIPNVSMTPEDLLELIQEIEFQFGRERNRFLKRKKNRTLDLDILLYGKRIIQIPRLQIPHYDLTNRDFFLRPLLELNPDLKNPLDNRPYQEYLDLIPNEYRTLDETPCQPEKKID